MSCAPHGALRLALLLALVACAVAACGKSAGPGHALAPVAEQGAVSVVTGNTSRIGGSDAATDAAAVARSVYPGLTPATRPDAVVIADEANWPAALTASVLASAPLRAPELFAGSGGLSGVSSEAIEAMHPLGSSHLGGAQVIRVGTSASPPGGLRTLDVPSGSAASTAAAVERVLARAVGAEPHKVIVVPPYLPRALLMPVAGLSAEGRAPILFATAAGVPRATESVLSRLGHPAIYVIGAGQLHHPTMQALRHFGHVTAINGPYGGAEDRTPSGNAIAISRFTDGSFGWGIKGPGHGLVFANAARPLDGPAAALLSASTQYGPMLLFEHPNRIPSDLQTYLTYIQPAYTSVCSPTALCAVYNHGWLIGDEHMISPVMQAELDSLLAITPRRQSGEDAAAQAEQEESAQSE